MKIFFYISVLLMTTYISAKEQNRLFWPDKPDPARIEFINSVKKESDLGIKKGFFAQIASFLFGDKDISLSNPFGIYIEDEKIYVTDITAKVVYIYDLDEEELIILTGTDNEHFIYPLDIVADKKGNIYVSDSVRAKIFVFEEDGDFSHFISFKQMQRPIGLAFDPDKKNLYIVDSLASQIHVCDIKGNYLRSIGKKGAGKAEFNRPTYMDVGKDGKLYITDSMNHRIQVLSKKGDFLFSFGKLGDNIGDFGSPRGIALDSDENIYVSDTLFNVIQIFNPRGELLMYFSSYGRGRGKLALPEDISITSDNTIYISDTNNQRIQIYKRLDVPIKRSTK